jgi:hypothetical protein
MTRRLSLKPRPRAVVTLSLAAAACALALVLAPGARAGLVEVDLSPISVGPITVANGVATITGTVGGATDATANLTVNGQPIGLNIGGKFTAVVDLGGQSLIELVLDTPATGEQSVLRIPLTLLGPGGTIPSNVLDPLLDAKIEILLPPGGILATDDGGLTVEGTVLGPDSLLSLTINGRSVTPGPGGGFTVPLPPGTREVVVVATGRNGVSQTSTFPVTQLGSTISTSQGTSVSAAGALGVRIVSIKYKPNAQTKRVRMIVTVKDRRGYLIRDAIVTVKGMPARAIQGGVQAATTNRIGKATLVLRPQPALFGGRLATRTTAKTPSAAATKVSSTRLPRPAR